MKPVLRMSVSSITPAAAAVDLTAVTGGIAGGRAIRGYTGAAWWCKVGHYGKHKGEANSQLNPVAFSDDGPVATDVVEGGFSSYNNPATYVTGDCMVDNDGVGDLHAVQYGETCINANVGRINAGQGFFAWTSLDARHLEVLADIGGSFRANASFADGSIAAVSKPLPNGLVKIAVDFVDDKFGGKLLFEIRRTGNTGNALGLVYAWVGLPTRLMLPRGLIHAETDKLGGANS